MPKPAGAAVSRKKHVFDAAYYERYYLNRRTRVVNPEYFEHLAAFLRAYCDWVGIDIRSILDLGCGIGSLREPLERRFAKATYTGVDVSAYACDRYGWERAAIGDYDGDAADLVVCHDVLQYLRPGEAKEAIRKLATLSGEVLYFSVLTREDWEENCDKARTDGDVHLRPASWYRARLARSFRNLGGGFYLPRSSGVVVYALEHLD